MTAADSRAAADVPDEGRVELDHVGRDVREATEGGVAGAEVVDGETYTEFGDGQEYRTGGDGVVQDLGFGDFQVDPGRVQAGGGEHGGEFGGEVGSFELAGRDVDEHPPGSGWA